MWLLTKRHKTHRRADLRACRGSQVTSANRMRAGRLRPGVELLENRLAPAIVGLGPDGVTYQGLPGEANNVVFANGPFLVVDENPDVGLAPAPPFFLSSFLQSFNLSLGVSAGIGTEVEIKGVGIDVTVGVSVGIGFSIVPVQFPGIAVGPPVPAGHTSAQQLSSAIQNVIAASLPQNGSSVVPGGLVPQDGSVFFKVTAPSDIDQIDNYQLYQAAVDPNNTFPEHEYNDDHTPTGANTIPAFSQVSPLVTGDIADGTPDYFRFHADAGQRIVVMLDNNPDRLTDPQKITGTALSLWGPQVTVLPPPVPVVEQKALNLSTDQGNAVGAFDAPIAGDYYVGVNGLGLGTGTDYRFIVLKLDPTASQSESSNQTLHSTDVPKVIPDNDPGGVSSSLSVPLGAGPGNITHLSVSLNITHTRDSDLEADLVGPDGTTVPLFSGVGDNGANFGDATTDTTLDDNAGTPIGSGTAPFTGTFRPQGNLSDFNGKDPRGAWQLIIKDLATGQVGTLNNWSLSYSTDEAGTSHDAAAPLGAGQFGTGAIGAGDTDFWSAPATAGQLVFSYVDTQNSKASKDSLLAVFANDGKTPIGSADNGGAPGLSPGDASNARQHLGSSGLTQLSEDVSSKFSIDVGNHGSDAEVNSVDVSTLTSDFTVYGGANIDTLLAGAGQNTFYGCASPDVFVNNFSLPSENWYHGGDDNDQILVQGLGSADTFDINFATGDDTTFVITEDGVPAIYHIPERDVEQILIQGFGGNDTVAIHGDIPGYLTSGINFEGGAGDNQIVLDSIAPGEPILYRKGVDDGSGSITVGDQPPIVFAGVPRPPALPAVNPIFVFPHDPFENNNSMATATPIGAGAALNQVATIDPPTDFSLPRFPDQDWYKFTAQETGTLDFQVDFTQSPNLPGDGNLDINIYDAAGDLIGASRSADDGERVAIPVVRNQVYFLQVVGATSDAVNVYDFSVINVPAPPPFQVDLTDATDTGRDNHDNVTDNPAPTLNVFLDDARLLEFLNQHMQPDTVDNRVHDGDFGVDVYDNGVLLGSAAFVGPTNSVPANHWVYHVIAGQFQEGSNFLTAAVWFRDRATPAVTGRGDFSLPLLVVLDTTAPPPPPNQGLAPPLNTTNPGLTNNPLPTFNGIAEPGAIIRLYADRNCDGMIGPDEVLLGTTIASLVDGRWSITSQVSLNDPNFFTRDGERCLLTTAEDQAGNVSAPSPFDIFLDTQGPQVTNVYITNQPTYDLFKLKPNDGNPTPRIDSLTVSLRDLPGRDPGFPYVALDQTIAGQASRYILQGDRVGIIPIKRVVVTNSTSAGGQVGTATVDLQFAAPLPDDRYTLTLFDSLVDPVGNALDGESNATQPTGSPQFPSGDTIAGGDFVARFTMDSRSEIGAYSAGRVFLDINGNGIFDPSPVNNDQTNHDLTFTFGTRQDLLFAGNFAPAGATTASGFSKLAAYGQANGTTGPWRFLIDFNGDGVPDLNIASSVSGNGWLPVAGNFAPNHPGDEIGLFNAGKWVLDSNGDHNLGNTGDLQIQGSMKGLPFVGDFDGDGRTDLATYNAGVFSFDFAVNGLTGNADATINFGFPGPFEQPVAGDFNLDGVTDFGLFIPEQNGPPPSEAGQWYILVSSGRPVPGTVNTLNHGFSPAPLGTDLYYQFGDVNESPIVGNFDPPVSASSGPAVTVQAPTNVAPGSIFTLNLAASGAGADALNVWTVNWGDGSQSTFAGPPQPVNHAYANAPGSYTVGVTGTSQDGSASAMGTATVTVNYANPNQRFVSQIYLDLLQRSADPAGLAFWTHVLDVGLPRTQVAMALANSAEHRGMEVDALYQTYLHRPADAVGRAAWVAARMSGVSETDVARVLLGSVEYQAAHSDNDSFVNGLYADVLGRAADAVGRAAMLHTLQQGESRAQLAWAVLTSPEHYQGVVQEIYDTYLHRPPDAGSLANWLALLQSRRVTSEQIGAVLMASDELFRQL